VLGDLRCDRLGRYILRRGRWWRRWCGSRRGSGCLWFSNTSWWIADVRKLGELIDMNDDCKL
jgi:hypothetical protein